MWLSNSFNCFLSVAVESFVCVSFVNALFKEVAITRAGEGIASGFIIQVSSSLNRKGNKSSNEFI